MPRSRIKPQLGAHLPTECNAVLVGTHAETLKVEVVFILGDGTMWLRGRVHIIPPGRTAVGQAITALGLTRLRRFQAAEIRNALHYARRLHAEMQGGSPHIL